MRPQIRGVAAAGHGGGALSRPFSVGGPPAWAQNAGDKVPDKAAGKRPPMSGDSHPHLAAQSNLLILIILIIVLGFVPPRAAWKLRATIRCVAGCRLP